MIWVKLSRNQYHLQKSILDVSLNLWLWCNHLKVSKLRTPLLSLPPPLFSLIWIIWNVSISTAQMLYLQMPITVHPALAPASDSVPSGCLLVLCNQFSASLVVQKIFKWNLMSLKFLFSPTGRKPDKWSGYEYVLLLSQSQGLEFT